MPRNRRNRCGRLGARVIDSSNPASGSSAGNLNPPVGLDRSAGNLEIRPRNEIIVQFHCFIIRLRFSACSLYYFSIVGWNSYDMER